MNIYTHRFSTPCPNNEREVDYELDITTERTIMVEEIVAACQEAKACDKPYHETMAEFLYAKFGGRQQMRAHHHGVDILTIRG